MKSFFVLEALAASAFAQRATIVSPANGTSVTSGDTLVIDVRQKVSPSLPTRARFVLTETYPFSAQIAATDEVQVAIALGVDACPSGSCDGYDPATNGVGTILFSGTWEPAFDPEFGFHQNFSVTVPEFASAGQALLSLTHLEFIGVSYC